MLPMGSVAIMPVLLPFVVRADGVRIVPRWSIRVPRVRRTASERPLWEAAPMGQLGPSGRDAGAVQAPDTPRPRPGRW